MIIRQLSGLTPTEPPCTPLFMLCQDDNDRAAMAEMVDLGAAARCVDQKVREQAITGRVMVSALASELGVASKEQFEQPEGVHPAVIKYVGDLAESAGVTADTVLSKGFVVRFLHW
jgi:hypothetical protein